MIRPTVGRVVWYRPYIKPITAPGMFANARDGYDNAMACIPGEPLSAQVVAVAADDCVSLAVTDINAVVHSRHNVLLWQGEGERPTGRRFCEWMPYQKAVAAGEIPATKHAT